MSCPDCFRGGKAVGEPKGSIESLHGVKTYIASPTPTSNSGATIIIFTDAFGLALVNNKLLADSIATATKLRVLVPDIIPRGPMAIEVLTLMDTVMEPVAILNLRGQALRLFSLCKALGYVIPWYWHAFPGPETLRLCLEYARKVKAEMPSSAKLGVAGYCWGGYQSINLSSQPAVEGGSEPLVDAQFCAHPSKLNLPTNIIDAVMKFKTPVAIAHAKDDMALSMEKVEITEADLRQKAGDGKGENGFYYEVRIYDGCAHGFAVRAKPGSEREAEAADEAKEQAIEWFKRWL